MNRYFATTEYVADRVCLRHAGAAYTGRGLLRWAPEDGFRLDAFVDRDGTPTPPESEIGRVRVMTREDRSSIRLWLQGGGRAFAPHVVLADRFDITEQGRLSIRLAGLLFLDTHTPRDSRVHEGAALYRFARGPVMPDVVEDVKRVGQRRVVVAQRAEGVRHNAPRREHVVGWMCDDRHMELHWTLRPSAWSRNDAWVMADAARVALSFASGQDVQLLQRRVYRSGYGATEVFRAQDARSLDLLAPLHGGVRFDKKVFVHLLPFLVRERLVGGNISGNVVRQLSEATGQTNWQTRELLVATILEAVLRTAFGQPFVPGVMSWDLGAALEQFRTLYLDARWEHHCKAAVAALRRLRHRNAHPDWLTTGGGALSEERLSEAVDDMVFLSHFYGCMVLALARYDGLRPRFPKPHREWAPAFRISRASAS